MDRGARFGVAGCRGRFDAAVARDAEAAVALVCAGLDGPDPSLLLIHRAEVEGDPWSGHAALPGGHRDPADPDPLATALREAREEVGIEIPRAALLGSLETITTALPPRIRVQPYVFGLPEPLPLRPSAAEVARALWVPLSELRDPARRDRTRFHWRGRSVDLPCIRSRGLVIWGLTYRVLQDFFARLEAGGGLRPARGVQSASTATSTPSPSSKRRVEASGSKKDSARDR